MHRIPARVTGVTVPEAMVIDRAKTIRGAVAGAVAAAVWLAQQPLDKPIFGVDYDDSELLGKIFTRGRAWPVVGAVLHLGNGALLGAAYANVASRLPLPSWSRGPVVALGEHLATWPLTLAVDRLHPARDEMPRLGRAARAPSLRRRGAICSSGSSSVSSSGA